jgi:TolB-like protein/class 3 adenylate cyclase/Tfp pilus assembly protein PilF
MIAETVHMSVAGAKDLVGKSLAGRKLIVVLYADMAGYSRLIGLDDVGTLQRLRSLRTSVIDPAIDQHGGRTIQTAGDSLLVVFDSIDGAVSCALAVQNGVAAHDGAHPDRAIRFRIGLNIGDAIADGTELHGDVVNVAVRLQAECPPGRICVSRAVRDHVRDQPDLSFEELGALNLKNIARPIEAFVLRPGGAGSASVRGQQSGPDDRSEIVFADCVVDLHRRELRRGGRVIHVEPQVYDLLVHLVRNRDRVVGKDELLDTIWNGRVVSDAALSSRINAGRKAIGDDGDRQALIKTIHRRGFRFVGVVQETTNALTENSSKARERLVDSTLVTTDESRKPSVAVLPFMNLSQEPDTDYFSYGLTEDVIRLLARHRWLDVLSRHSAIAFRGRDTDPRAIGSELGVRYLVHGNVMKRGERVSITVDLVSAVTGHQLWWDSYDVSLENILDVQQMMAQQIAAVIEPELARLEREAAVRRPPVTLGAWDCYQRGLYHLWGFTSPGLAEGEAMFRRAIELDPGFARAHGALAYVTLQSLVQRDPSERTGLLEEALGYGKTAVALDGQDCMNLCVVGRVLCFRHEYEEAAAFLEEAIRINPSFAQAYFALGFTLIVSGKARDGLTYLDRATQLSPRDPHLASFHTIRAVGHFALGDLDTAERFARIAARIPNANHWPLALLVSLLAIKQRSAETVRAADVLLQRYPGYSVATARSDFFFCGDSDLVERFLDGLRHAGLPETAAPDRARLARPATLAVTLTEEATAN